VAGLYLLSIKGYLDNPETDTEEESEKKSN
jgi:hypothetical protein